jgi:hypothetical protein
MRISEDDWSAFLGHLKAMLDEFRVPAAENRHFIYIHLCLSPLISMDFTFVFCIPVQGSTRERNLFRSSCEGTSYEQMWRARRPFRPSGSGHKTLTEVSWTDV